MFVSVQSSTVQSDLDMAVLKQVNLECEEQENRGPEKKVD